MHFLIKPLSEQADLQSKLDQVHANLLAADLRTYPQTTEQFDEIRKHPTKDLICACFSVNVPEWQPHVDAVVDSNELENLTSDWSEIS